MLYIEHTHVTRVRVCLHFARLLFQHRKIINNEPIGRASRRNATSDRPRAAATDIYLRESAFYKEESATYESRTMNNAIRAALCICTWGKIFGS